MKTQDPKFYIHKDRIHGQSKLIPADEPLFIFRARDVNAIAVLERYLELAKMNGSDNEHLEGIKMRILDFTSFKKKFPHRMKVPDTCLARYHDGKIKE